MKVSGNFHWTIGLYRIVLYPFPVVQTRQSLPRALRLSLRSDFNDKYK
jgi:hypothetical protein